MSRIVAASEALRGILVRFMPTSQRRILTMMLRGEEAEGTADLILNVVEQIKGTPLTYQTEGIETADKKLCLHYFGGPVDAWIVERDMGANDPIPGEGEQRQAYGKRIIGGTWNEAEWGYISIQEMIAHNVELDLYWDQKTVKEMK